VLIPNALPLLFVLAHTLLSPSFVIPYDLAVVNCAGPLNYNPVEEWFFHRIKEGRPIPVPNSGQQVGSSTKRILMPSSVAARLLR